jgi:hypothetical protein
MALVLLLGVYIPPPLESLLRDAADFLMRDAADFGESIP